MSTNDLHGVVLDERVTFTLREVCHTCGVHAEFVIEMVEEGVIEPIDSSSRRWQFSGRDLIRAQKALRLTRDLRLNWPGAALVLDLLEEIERLRQRTPRA